MKISEQLQAALDAMRTKGWCKWQRHNFIDGSVCAIGAIETAMGATLETRIGLPAYLALEDKVQEVYPDRSTGKYREAVGAAIANFNNHPDTAQIDVEQAFEKTIVGLQEIGQ